MCPSVDCTLSALKVVLRLRVTHVIGNGNERAEDVEFGSLRLLCIRLRGPVLNPFSCRVLVCDYVSGYSFRLAPRGVSASVSLGIWLQQCFSFLRSSSEQSQHDDEFPFATTETFRFFEQRQ